MKIVIRVRDFDMMPWSHREIWYDPCRRVRVCAPLGLHWIIRICRRIWISTYRWRPDAWERACCEMDAKLEKEYRERLSRLRSTNRRLLEVCRNAIWAYEALRLVGLHKQFPGFNSCVEDLEAAIKEADE